MTRLLDKKGNLAYTLPLNHKEGDEEIELHNKTYLYVGTEESIRIYKEKEEEKKETKE